MAKAKKVKGLMYEGKITCPYCERRVKFSVLKEILTPGTKAETQLKLKAEKDDQQILKG
jgi:uncharacterized Zn finger protein (UPF0148 family)